jgi:uncharacterized protein
MAISLPARIPLFPLPDTVLFPGVPLALHIFEPRYRAMVKDALRGPRVIGMVLLRPVTEGQRGGVPPIFEVGCAGIISQYEELPDGGYNLTLLGQSAFQIEAEETSVLPYRLARVVYRDETGQASPEEIHQLRDKVARDINNLARASGSNEDVFDTRTNELIPDDEFVNVLCHMIGMSNLEKQALLEANGVAERYRKLIDMVAFWRLGIGRARGSVQ